MSTRYNNGSHYENHQRATELQDAAAHAHRTGEQHGKQEHLTAHEQTRRAFEHSAPEHSASEQTAREDIEGSHRPQNGTTGHGVSAFGHEDIASLAYALWEKRGCPEGSAEEDWFHAVKELRTRAISGSGNFRQI